MWITENVKRNSDEDEMEPIKDDGYYRVSDNNTHNHNDNNNHE